MATFLCHLKMVDQSDAPFTRLITARGSKHNIKLIVFTSHAPECEVVMVLVVVLVFVVLVSLAMADVWVELDMAVLLEVLDMVEFLEEGLLEQQLLWPA